MKVRRKRRKEQGSILVLTLVFLALFGTVVGIMLSFGQVGLKLHKSETTKSHSLYAADGALQDAVNLTKNNNGICPAGMLGAGQQFGGGGTAMSLPSDVSSVNVKCQQYTGPGTNTFGGYSVVGGVNVNSSGVYTLANSAAPQSCTSLSADPVANNAATFGAGTAGCLNYPPAAAPPTWLTGFTPTAAPIPNLNGAFVYDTTDQWFVGTTSASPFPKVWFYDSDDYSDATGTGGGVLPANFKPAKVWATISTGTAFVFVGGTTTTGVGRVYLSTNSLNSTSGGVVTWTNQATISGATSITDVYGLPDLSAVWAVGTTATGPAVWQFNGASWGAATQLLTATAVNGVWAADASHVWAAGTNNTGKGAVWSCIAAVAPCTWSPAPALPASTTSLNDVRGSDATHVFVVGSNTAGAPPGQKGVVSFASNNTNWTTAVQPSGGSTALTLTAIEPVNSTHIWAVGTSTAGSNPGTIWFCTATCTTAANWTTAAQKLPTLPSPMPAQSDISGVPVGAGFSVSSVGANGNVLTYAPTAGTSCGGAGCPAKISGGGVFNGNALSLASGLSVPDGDFTQYKSGACGAKPGNLTVTNYGCVSSLPSFFNTNASTLAPLPTAKPAAAAAQAGTFVAASGACTTGYTYFTPGKYTSKIMLGKDTTYFFESGVYDFEGGWGALDDGKVTPANDHLFVIGGKPSPGDVPTIAPSSPCWNAIQANNAVYNGGSGTGVEWILAGATWLDVHTVNMELFTREGGAASEGAQGFSVRDVSGVAAGNPVWGSVLNVTNKAPNQLFQVDANGHDPNVYVHGGIYTPNENVEEFANASAVTLGPIWANSIELSFGPLSTPAIPLVISGGAPGNPTVVFTATGPGGVTIQSFVPYDTTGAATVITDPAKGYSYRVLSPQ